MGRIFNNAGVLTRSWYAVHPSAKLKAGRPKSVEFFDHKITLYRDSRGTARALYAFCPHMGADLGSGKIDGDRLVCPYHRWSFDKDGRCAGKQARTHSYPIVERYGYLWIFNGEQAGFSFPKLAWDEGEHYVVRLPSAVTRCHPHVLGINVADFTHLETLHGFKFDRRPELIEEREFSFVHRYRIDFAPKGMLEKLFRAYAGRYYDFEISLIGDNTVTMEIRSQSGKYHLKALINLAPTAEGHSLGRTLLFVPKGKGLVRLLRLRLLKLPLILASFVSVQMQDLKVFNNMRFKIRPDEDDPSVTRYMKMVERLGAFNPAKADRCIPAGSAHLAETAQEALSGTTY